MSTRDKVALSNNGHQWCLLEVSDEKKRMLTRSSLSCLFLGLGYQDTDKLGSFFGGLRYRLSLSKMFVNRTLLNVTNEQLYQGTLERALFSVMTTVPCCIFLYINGTMLFTLRTKTVFQETCRYIFLFHLLFGDTVQMGMSQVLYVLAACRTKLTYPLCGVLSMITRLTSEISPLALVVMSLERYIAVCHPLRHAIVVTRRTTHVAVFGIWAISSLNVFVQLVLLLDFPFAELESLQMNDFCSNVALFLGPMSDTYEKAVTWTLFAVASLAIAFSYVGVMIVARTASTNKTSIEKARNTLLLHLVQLALILSSTLYTPMLIGLSRITTRLIVVRVQNVLYLFVIIFPRCLSPLIYGIRDKNMKPALMQNLCSCWLSLSVPADKQSFS